MLIGQRAFYNAFKAMQIKRQTQKKTYKETNKFKVTNLHFSMPAAALRGFSQKTLVEDFH